MTGFNMPPGVTPSDIEREIGTISDPEPIAVPNNPLAVYDDAVTNLLALAESWEASAERYDAKWRAHCASEADRLRDLATWYLRRKLGLEASNAGAQARKTSYDITSYEDLSLEIFCNALSALIGSDLPSFIDLSDYRPGLTTLWDQNPARAFLRLTEADRRKVWQEIRRPK